MARLRFGRPISLRWNGLLLEGPALTVFEIPDEYYEEFDEDIGTVEPTLEWLDADEGDTIRDRLDALEAGGGGASLSSDSPLALGTAAAGTGTEASRDDHVHPTTGLALSGHNHDGSYATTGHDHSGTYEPVNTAILKSIVDAKGDIIVATGSDTVSRLAVGATNDYVLTVDSSTSTGVAWKAQTGGGGGGASLSNDAPLALGTAAAGTGSEASRDDHVHPTTGLALSGHDHDATYVPIADANRADIVFEQCKNSSGGSIAKGKVVYIDGSDGTNPTIALADADSEATSSKTLGFTETASNNGDQVNVITQGRLTNVDTSGAATEGVAVWLSGTAGGVVFGTPPAEPAHSVYLGVVTKKNANTGEIFVKVQNGYELDELHDVSVGSPTAGDLIQWATDGTNYMWRKKSLSDAGIASSSHAHGTASTGGTYGVTTLTDSTSSTSTTTAATPASVKSAYDLANGKVASVAGTGAISSTGGTAPVISIAAATTSVVGAVQLTDATNSTSTTTAATPNSVKSAYDLAGTAIPKNTVTAAGDLLYASGSATVTRLGIGTANQVLSVSGTVPAWTTPATGGGWTALGTVTASAGTAISFTSIPTTYKHLVVRWQDVYQSTTAGYLGVRFNNNSGSVYWNKGWNNIQNVISQTVTTAAWLDSNITSAIGYTSDTSARTKSAGHFIVYDYANTSTNRMAFCESVYTNSATDATGIEAWAVYASTGTAITQIDFVRSSTQTITGTFYLYGVS